MRILLAIPVYNEERHLAGVLRRVLRYDNLDVLAIDDGSTDGTARVLDCFPKVRVILHLENRGYGQSLIDAFAFAREQGYDWVITMDCDEQHEPAQLADFVAAIRKSDADIISGSRYLAAHAEDDAPPADRRQINQTVCLLLDQLLNLRLTDSFCGFKAHRVAALARLNLTEPGYAFPLQFWVQCVRAGLAIEELAVTRIYRDRNRRFGGTLDDPAARLQHYLEVLLTALQAEPVAAPMPESVPWNECCLPL
ncbi:MAG: glycosyltransferase family 2 protein [Phycisphaerae bacterium]|nr:glycosyltransferase family 2 protein [Phycisphaerae bacterium]